MGREISIEDVLTGLDDLGIVLDSEGKTVLHVPAFYLPRKKLTLKDISPLLIFKLRTLFSAWSQFSKTVDRPHNGAKGEGSSYYDFEVVLELIKDFAEFGLYTESEKTDVVSKTGKINFHKTVQKLRPEYSESGFFYLPYYSTTKKYKDESFLRELQSLALNEISKSIGWLIGFTTQFPSSGTHKLDDTSKQLLFELKQSSFNSRKIHLIGLLTRYIDTVGTAESQNGNFVLGKAWQFWEEMVRCSLGNLPQSEISDRFNVKHIYVDKKTNEVITRLTPLRPDAVLETDDGIALLDGKYYVSQDLPDNESVTKQFVYLRKAKAINGVDKNYSNIFILPTEEKTHYSDTIAVFDEDIGFVDEYDQIKILRVNVSDLILAYVEHAKISI